MQKSDDWTEAKKKQHKRPVSERRERGGRRALAGTVPDGNVSGNGSGRRERKGKRGGRKRDNGVRDMKPRPCHTYYLSKSFVSSDLLSSSIPISRNPALVTHPTLRVALVIEEDGT